MTREEVRDEILSMNNSHILLELPTSFGKTKIALDLMAKKGITTKSKILIVVPRLVLIDTWKDELVKWGYKRYTNIEFVTYVSFPKRAGEWDLIIFDECHHLSERCRESLDTFIIHNSILLSATVKRDLKFAFRVLFRNIGMYKVDIKDATEEGILPDPRVFLIPLQLDNKVAKYAIIKNPKKGNPLTISYAERWKYTGVKNRTIIIKCTQLQYYNDMSQLIEWFKKRIHREAFKQMFLHRSGDRLKWLSDQKTSFILHLLVQLQNTRTLTFCNSIAQTEMLGTNCVNSKNKESDEILERFNTGEIDHITACNMLDEGVNLVNCRVGIYASLNSSERMIKQKLGRLLRHKDPIIIIPFYRGTRDAELVKKMCEDYNPQLIETINLNNLQQCLKNLKD